MAFRLHLVSRRERIGHPIVIISVSQARSTLLGMLSLFATLSYPVLLNVAAAPQVPVTRADGSLEVVGVPSSAPFTVEATASDRVLRLQLEIERGWHMYSADVGGGAPISVAVDGDFENAGDPVFPPDPRSYIEGRAEIVVPIRRSGGAASDADSLEATVSLQVCDALECLEPMTIELRGAPRALSAVLVVGEADEHAKRIESWLMDRGFEVASTTYSNVETSVVEASDVVIADSKSFGAARAALRDLERFPRTDTPVFAVGFLGTELIEEHGLAMTSGYI